MSLPSRKDARDSFTEAGGLGGMDRMLDELRHDHVGGLVVGLGVEVGHDAVPHDGRGDGPNIGDVDMQAALDRCSGLRRQDQMLTRARSRSPGDVLLNECRSLRMAVPGEARERQGEADHRIGDRDLADDGLHPLQLLVGQDRREFRRRQGGGLADDLKLFVLVGVVDADLEHEPVELGFGEWIGALLLDGVLGGEDKERLGEWMPDAAHGDMVFLHRFEERGLRLGRRAVDLIGQDDVGKDRPFDESQLAQPGRAVLDRKSVV